MHTTLANRLMASFLDPPKRWLGVGVGGGGGSLKYASSSMHQNDICQLPRYIWIRLAAI